MFVAMTPSGDETYHGQPCYTWYGIPSFEELVKRLDGNPLMGLLIITDLQLSRHQINTYVGSAGRTWGSYDGQTLRVGYHEIGSDPNDPDTDRETYRGVLEIVFKGVIRLYFKIIHGRAQGLHDITPIAAPNVPDAD